MMAGRANSAKHGEQRNERNEVELGRRKECGEIGMPLRVERGEIVQRTVIRVQDRAQEAPHFVLPSMYRLCNISLGTEKACGRNFVSSVVIATTRNFQSVLR